MLESAISQKENRWLYKYSFDKKEINVGNVYSESSVKVRMHAIAWVRSVAVIMIYADDAARLLNAGLEMELGAIVTLTLLRTV